MLEEVEMKRFIRAASMMVAVIGIMVGTTSCKNDSSSGTAVPGPVGGVPGYTGGVVIPTPGGGAQISFSGSNIFNNGSALSGGQVSGYGGSCGYYGGMYGCTYSGNFASGYASWLFSNPGRTTTGSLGIGAASMLSEPLARSLILVTRNGNPVQL